MTTHKLKLEIGYELTQLTDPKLVEGVKFILNCTDETLFQAFFQREVDHLVAKLEGRLGYEGLLACDYNFTLNKPEHDPMLEDEMMETSVDESMLVSEDNQEVVSEGEPALEQSNQRNLVDYLAAIENEMSNIFIKGGIVKEIQVTEGIILEDDFRLNLPVDGIEFSTLQVESDPIFKITYVDMEDQVQVDSFKF